MVINGGEKDNAIAKTCEAAIAVLPQETQKVKKIIKDTFEEIKDEYKVTDTNAKIAINEMDENLVDVFSGPATLAVIIALVNMPNGIQRMNPEVEGMVQTSLNLGILRTDFNKVKLSYAVRSSKDSEKSYIIEKLRSLTEIFGGEIKVSGAYSGWEYKSDSRLREISIEAFKELYGREPLVEGIHAGLECGLFADKIKDLDAISIGPDMREVHTTGERLCISSSKRTFELIIKILEMLK